MMLPVSKPILTTENHKTNQLIGKSISYGFLIYAPFRVQIHRMQLGEDISIILVVQIVSLDYNYTDSNANHDFQEKADQ